MEKEAKLTKVIEIIKRHNYLRNDFDAYLYEVCNYGLGFREKLPNPKDYGLDESN